MAFDSQIVFLYGLCYICIKGHKCKSNFHFRYISSQEFGSFHPKGPRARKTPWDLAVSGHCQEKNMLLLCSVVDTSHWLFSWGEHFLNLLYDTLQIPILISLRNCLLFLYFIYVENRWGTSVTGLQVRVAEKWKPSHPEVSATHFLLVFLTQPEYC